MDDGAAKAPSKLWVGGGWWEVEVGGRDEDESG